MCVECKLHVFCVLPLSSCALQYTETLTAIALRIVHLSTRGRERALHCSMLTFVSSKRCIIKIGETKIDEMTLKLTRRQETVMKQRKSGFTSIN